VVNSGWWWLGYGEPVCLAFELEEWVRVNEGCHGGRWLCQVPCIANKRSNEQGVGGGGEDGSDRQVGLGLVFERMRGA